MQNNKQYKPNKYFLLVIVFSQFLCTSLWFAGNSVINDIAIELKLESFVLAHLTSAIQFGFITGTLVFAILTISDRFSPSLVFFISAILAGLFNLCILIQEIALTEILFFRFLTGFFLAGIYPVGMKIASDYHQKGLGKSLGFLVGALVIGTAFPHLLKIFTFSFPWQDVIYATTIMSLMGGFLMLSLIPDGPFRNQGQRLKFTSFLDGFKHKEFRSIAFGYFGHMWELYAFWAFVPVMLTAYNIHFPTANLNISLYSFLIIASGAFSCIISGLFSQKFGAKKIATISLIISGTCCLVSPFFLLSNSVFTLLAFLFIWGFSVIADSPLFSTLIAQNAPAEARGTSLTIVNCIGFAITIVSIQSIGLLLTSNPSKYIYVFLALGPLIGVLALTNEKRISAKKNNSNIHYLH